MTKSLLPIFLALFLLSIKVQAQSAETFRKWGEECFTVINRDFKSATYSHLYKQNSTKVYPTGDLAFCWPYGIQWKALLWAGKVKDAETSYSQFHQLYYCKGSSKADATERWAYNASAKSSGDRYYDDNAWIARTLLDLYDSTKTQLYLTRARMVLDFCLSGMTPNGGIRWHEKYSDPEAGDTLALDKAKWTYPKYPNGWNLIATASTMCASLQMYKYTQEEYYLEKGRTMYRFLRGQPWGIGPGYRAYENAVILQSALLLYQFTKDDVQYASESSIYFSDIYWLANSMEACYISWQSHRLNETGEWGGHDVTDAYVALYEFDKNPYWLSVIAGYLSYLHSNYQNAVTWRNKPKFNLPVGIGYYPQNWKSTSSDTISISLEHMASAAAAYFRMASTLGAEPKALEPVAIFRQKNYNIGQEGGNWSIGLQPGEYNSAKLRALGHTNNRFVFEPSISSLIVTPGYKVILYLGDNFTGSSTEITESSANIGTWDDKARSLKVIQLTSAIETNKGNTLQVFPTIFKDVLHIKDITEPAEILIVDMLGRVLYKEQTREQSLEIGTSTFPSGTYIISIQYGPKTQKKILQKIM